MRNFLVILITLMLFALWLLPAYLVGFLHQSRHWCDLYFALLFLTFFWVNMLYKEDYFSK